MIGKTNGGSLGKDEQEKSVTITTNNSTTTITPDNNKVLSKVTVNVNVPASSYVSNLHFVQGTGNVSQTFNVQVNQLIHIVSARFNDTRAPTISVSGAIQVYHNVGTWNNQSGWIDDWWQSIQNSVAVSVTHPANNPLFTFIN